MLIYLLRHGLTQENLEKRYQAGGMYRCAPRALPSCAGRILPQKRS